MSSAVSEGVLKGLRPRLIRDATLAASGIGLIALSVALPVFTQRHLFILYYIYAIFAALYATFVEAMAAAVITCVAIAIASLRSGLQAEAALENIAVDAVLVVGVIALLTLIRRTRLAYQEAQAARIEAEAALQACTSSVSFVAHDLNNPLMIVRGYIQVAQPLVEQLRTPERERLIEVLAHIDKASIAMAHMAQEILAAGQPQHPPVTLNRSQTDLVALVGDVVAEYQRINPHHRIHLHAAETTIEGYWNAPELERVLNNLLSNAVKYSPGGGDITLTAARNGDDAVLEVQDHGLGVPTQDLPRIFELFNRGTNVSGIKGSGLGLAGTRRIVAEHGGRITVDSREGVGTRFTVTLPLNVHKDADTNASST